jgi:hypothetical protein
MQMDIEVHGGVLCATTWTNRSPMPICPEEGVDYDGAIYSSAEVFAGALKVLGGSYGVGRQ